MKKVTMIAHARCSLTWVQQSQWTHQRSNQGSKFLNMSDGAQAVKGRLGVRCVAGSIIPDGQVTARSQGVWLNRNDDFFLDEELAGVIEEPLGDNQSRVH